MNGDQQGLANIVELPSVSLQVPVKSGAPAAGSPAISPLGRDRIEAMLALLAGTDVPDERRRAWLVQELAAIYCANPWSDPLIPSLLADDSSGAAVGCLGVIPRPMQLAGRRLRTAVSGNLRVRPDRQGRRPAGVGVRLLRELFAGPQDLTLADTSNARSMRLWEACGGKAAPLYSLDWFLPLRPSGLLQAQAMMGRDGRFGLTRRAAARLADLVGTGFMRRALGLVTQPLATAPFDAEAALDLLDRDAGARLRSSYDTGTLVWVAARAERKALPGTFRSRLVLDAGGQPVGWFAYLQQRPQVADMLQLVTVERDLGPVLSTALADAMAHGVALVRGAVDPRHLQAYRDLRCILSPGRWTLVHGRDPALVEPFLRGDARLQGFDGERWILEFPESV